MKKIILLFTLLLFTKISISQIEVGEVDSYGRNEFIEGSYETFLKTTTIFVFSNVFEKEFYQDMLSKNWTITPYKIVDYKDFVATDYLSSKYSFCILQAFKSTAGNEYMNSRLDLYILDIDNINKKIEKTKWEKYSKEDAEHRKLSIVLDYDIDLGAIYFYPYSSLIGVPPFSSLEYGKVSDLGYKKTEMSYSTAIIPNGPYLYYMGYTQKDDIVPLKEMHEQYYNEKIHYNYEKLMLSNYIQEFNARLLEKKLCAVKEESSNSLKPLAELKNLKTATLYLPEYLKISYDGWKVNDKKMSSSEISKMLSTYKYKTAWATYAELDQKLESGEEFYYLNYTRNQSYRQFQIVNGKTGQILYKFVNNIKTMDDFDPKDKDFEAINKVISEM